jgi:hypothetical protein
MLPVLACTLLHNRKLRLAKLKRVKQITIRLSADYGMLTIDLSVIHFRNTGKTQGA